LIQHEIYEFGPYVLDSAQMLLSRDGSVVPLQPRALEMLLVLMRRRGEVISKQELMEAVWPDSFVEEGNLTQNIFLLRRELGKTPEGEDYIHTLPKRGYRMNVPIVNLTAGEVRGSVGAEIVATDSGVSVDAAFSTRAGGRPGRQNWLLAAVPVLAMLLVLALGIAAAGRWRAETAQPRVSGYTQITRWGNEARIFGV